MILCVAFGIERSEQTLKKNKFIRRLSSKFRMGRNENFVVRKLSKLMRDKRAWARKLIQAHGHRENKPTDYMQEGGDALKANKVIRHKSKSSILQTSHVRHNWRKNQFHHYGKIGMKGRVNFFVRMAHLI